MPQLTPVQREKIIALRRKKLSVRSIAAELGCSICTVQRWIGRVGCISYKPPAPGRGRKRKADDAQLEEIEEILMDHQYEGTRQLVEFVRQKPRGMGRAASPHEVE
jgi:transposase